MRFIDRQKRLLSPDEERAYFQRLQDGDTDVREHLVESNLPLVLHIVNQYRNKGIDTDDLEQEGCVALIKAVDTFDLDRGVRFATYATTVIKTELVMFLNKTAAVTIPQNLRWERRQLINKSEELTEKLGRTPSVEELAEAVRKSPEQVDILLQAGYDNILPLDMPVPDADGLTLEDTLAADCPTHEDEILRLDLRRVIDKLNRRNGNIVKLRFGFIGHQEYTCVEIGRLWGLSRESIRKTLDQTLAHLAAVVGS